MNMKAVIFLFISLAVCSQAYHVRTVRQASSTTAPTSPTPKASSTATPTSPATSTSPPSSTTPPPTTPAKESSNSTENSTSQVPSSSEQPALTEKEYYDRILESARIGLAAFTLNFQQCAYNATGTNKNLLFSPVNVAQILATLLCGAEGETKAEILKAIGISTGKDLSQKENQIHLALGNLFENFAAEAHSNPATNVEIAQSIFLQNGTLVKDFFRNFSQTVYKNEIVEVDFSSPTVEAADIINKWIDNKTHHRVEKLVQPPLAKTTEMILSNMLFFNGEWEFPFSNETTWKPFKSDSGNYSVKMMSNVAEAYLLREPERNYSVLGLPYKGGDIVMYFVVPKKGHSLAELTQHLTTEDLRDISTKAAKVEDLGYEVPFMSVNDQLQLNSLLETIGIRTAFSAAHANFSNLADGVYVSQIIHKASLDVTEAGSTGSASTVAFIETKFPKDPFIVDRPFVCYVYHRSSGLVSFWGTIGLPVPNKLSQ